MIYTKEVENMCPVAVSYTHLDVYKRQLHIRLIGTIQHSFWIFTDRHLTVWTVCQTGII